MPDQSSNPSFDAQGHQIIDPTTATTQVLQREVASLKELMESRLGSMDRAVALLQHNADKSPSIAVVAEKVEALQDLHNERFSSLLSQIGALRTMMEAMSVASKEAIAAALQAQKEAVAAALQAAKEQVSAQNVSTALAADKTERQVTGQIQQIGQLIAQQAKSYDDKIDDLKVRNNQLEQRQGGAEARSTGSSATLVTVIAVISTVIALIAVGVAIVMATRGGP